MYVKHLSVAAVFLALGGSTALAEPPSKAANASKAHAFGAAHMRYNRRPNGKVSPSFAANMKARKSVGTNFQAALAKARADRAARLARANAPGGKTTAPVASKAHLSKPKASKPVSTPQ